MEVRRDMRLLISCKPYLDESFMGYVLRLTEKNGYDSLSWIFQVASMNYKKSRQGGMFAIDTLKSLTHFAQLAGVNSAEIFRLTYPRVAGSEGEPLHYFFGQPVPQHSLRLTKPRVCPDCLSESPYCRRQWELSVVTTCPKHQRLLLDECPNCSKRISWSRNRVPFCTCKFDWRDSPVSTVSEQELRLTRQIHRLCNLTDKAGNSESFPEPVSRLTLNDILLVLFFIAGQFRGISSTTTTHLQSSGRNQAFHNTLTNAYLIFENWPSNYFKFLDRRRIHERNVSRSYQRMKSTLYRDFGSFYSGLHSVLSGSQFDFMRSAFIDYVIRNRAEDGLSNSKPKKASGESFKNQYLLKSDVRRLLGVDYKWINYQIRTGKIRFVVRSKGKKRLIFIDVADVPKLKPTQSPS